MEMTDRDEEIRIMSLPKMQSKFRERMGEWQENDIGQFMSNGYPERMTTDLIQDLKDPETFQEWKDHWLRLPLPIDPVNPERGLWGMVDWKEADMMIHDDGYICNTTGLMLKETIKFLQRRKSNDY